MTNFNRNKIIYVRLFGFNFDEKKIEVPYKSTIKDFRAIINATKRTHLYKGIQEDKIEELKETEILHDKDILFLVIEKTGAATIKYGNGIWRVHKSDKDNIPSNFHAHSIKNGKKLDLYTGKLYSKKNKYIKKINKKVYKGILEDIETYDDYKERAMKILNLLY